MENRKVDPTELRQIADELMEYEGMLNPQFTTKRSRECGIKVKECRLRNDDPLGLGSIWPSDMLIGQEAIISVEEYNRMRHMLQEVVILEKRDPEAWKAIPEALIRAKGLPAFKQLRDALKTT